MEENITTTKQPPLWTRDFTILTVGTVISKLGSAISGFALGLLVLDYSGSTLLYALYLFIYNLPKVIMPVLSGPYLDKYSRKRTIYTLDFISALIYVIYACFIGFSNLNYTVLIIGCFLLGAIDSIYGVAYDSFYPMLVKEGNYTKAYSISSTLESLTFVMIPVSAILYNWIGIVPLFIFDAITFFIAAVLETQIKQEEQYTDNLKDTYTIKQYKKDLKEGIEFIRLEKGLLAITLYFMITMFAGGAFDTIVLPYFKATYAHGEYIYIYVLGCMVIGRVIGGFIHYRFHYPTNKKFTIAIVVYTTICLLEGLFLYSPIPVMMVACFTTGILGVTSYNIRASSTQSYVEDSKKARFNGIFSMAIMLGMLSGQLISGVLSQWIPIRIVLSVFMFINLLAVIFIMYRKKEQVKLIYNRQS